KLAEIETKLINLANAESKRTNDFLGSKRHEIGRLQFSLGAVDGDVRKLTDRMAENAIKIETHLKRMGELRTIWLEENALEFKESDTICPTCGQTLPIDKTDELREKFNLEKAENLKRIRADGLQLK